MKVTTIIDPLREEEVVIHAHERTEVIGQIEAFVADADTELVAYTDCKEIVRLYAQDVHCFLIEDGRIYALTDREKLRVKQRLYVLEQMLDHSFLKLNQSCIGNVSKIDRFGASIGGTLTVHFKNGHRDYVSRRQLKAVKERIGFSL